MSGISILTCAKNVRWLFSTWVKCRQKGANAQVRPRKAVKTDHEGLAKGFVTNPVDRNQIVPVEAFQKQFSLIFLFNNMLLKCFYRGNLITVYTVCLKCFQHISADYTSRRICCG